MVKFFVIVLKKQKQNKKIQKTSDFGVWALWGAMLIDCMGKVPRVCLCVQLLFKQPQAWEIFAYGRKNDKLELHFAKSESSGYAEYSRKV